MTESGSNACRKLLIVNEDPVMAAAHRGYEAEE
jgi:hypothetical protein